MEPERPNAYSRLEATSSVRERADWLAIELREHWDVVQGDLVADLVARLGEELHDALWGDLPAVERVRHRIPLPQLLATWESHLWGTDVEEGES